MSTRLFGAYQGTRCTTSYTYNLVHSTQNYGLHSTDSAAKNWAYTRTLACVGMAVKVVYGHGVSLYLLQTLIGVFTSGARKAFVVLKLAILDATQGHLMGSSFDREGVEEDPMACD